MINTCMKKENSFQIVKVQPGVASKSIAYKKVHIREYEISSAVKHYLC